MTTPEARYDVRAWPHDDEARADLAAYVEARRSGDDRAVLSADEGDFRGADLTGMDLVGAFLMGADLSGTRLARTDLFRANLAGADLDGADLTGAQLRKVEAPGLSAREAILAGADLFVAELDEADLRSADLRGALLSGTSLSGADLRGADLRACGFGGSPTYLDDARLADTLLTGANGVVRGPVDVGTESPEPLDGPALEAWFRDRGAPGVRVEG